MSYSKSIFIPHSVFTKVLKQFQANLMGVGGTAGAGSYVDTMKVEDNGVGTNGDHSSLVHQLANAVSPPQVLHDEEVSYILQY